MLHVDGEFDKKDEIILFQKSTLKKCQDVYIFRSKQVNSKYGKILLPSNVNSNQGYHARCYKRYTSVSLHSKMDMQTGNDLQDLSAGNENNSVEKSLDTPRERQLRSNSGMKSTSGTGILEEKCIFCEKKDRKHKGCREKLHLCITTAIQESIFEEAKQLRDTNFISKISGIDFIAKEVRYHQICRVEYSNKAKSSKKVKDSSSQFWKIRNAHKKAFESLCLFIEETIIKNEQVFFLSDLHSHYLRLVA